MNNKPVLLKNWSFGERNGSVRLQGNVYGHPDFEDGHSIYTSSLRSKSLKRRVCLSNNRMYHLEGPPDPDWITYLVYTEQLDDYPELKKYDSDTITLTNNNEVVVSDSCSVDLTTTKSYYYSFWCKGNGKLCNKVGKFTWVYPRSCPTNGVKKT